MDRTPIPQGEILLYENGGEKEFVSVVFQDETFWLTQKAMAELFDVNVPAISKHLSNIFEEGELFKEATVSKMEIVHSNSSGLSNLLPITSKFSESKSSSSS